MRRDPDATDRALIAAKACRAIRPYFAHAAGLPAGDDPDREYRPALGQGIAAPDRCAFSLA